MADAQRRRVSRACESCKVTRRKCSGEQPCENCEKRGIECVYDDAPARKRGPKKGTKRNSAAAAAAGVAASLVSLSTYHGGTHDRPAPRRELQTAHTHAATHVHAHAAANGLGAAAKVARLAVPALSHDPSADLPEPAGDSVVAPQRTQPVAQPPPSRLTVPRASNSRTEKQVVAKSVASSPLLESSVWSPPARIVPTEQESALLKLFFETSNRILPAVDQDYFYAALEEAKYYHEPGQAAGWQDGYGGGSEHPIAGVSRNSESFGFRVCYYTLLCAGARLEGQNRLAKHYYELARAYVGPCYAQPSQHLVSALLIMTIITRIVCQDVNQAACHAALALRMSELVEVTPEIRMVAVMMNYAHGSSTAQWPAPIAAPSTPIHIRFADILGFTVAQIIGDFPAVVSEREQLALQNLLEEARQLQTSTGLFAKWPITGISHAISSILYRRFHHYVLCFESSRKALEAVENDAHAGLCFPAVVLIARMIPVLESTLTQPELTPSMADKVKAMMKSACLFVRKTRTPVSCNKSDGQADPCAGVLTNGCGDSSASAAGGDPCSGANAASATKKTACCGKCPAGGCTCPRDTRSAIGDAAATMVATQHGMHAGGALSGPGCGSAAERVGEACTGAEPSHGDSLRAPGGRPSGGPCELTVQMPTDIIGMLGYVVVQTRCPVTGKVTEKRVPVSHARSSDASTVTTDAGTLHPDGSVSRPESQYDARRKAPIGSSSLRPVTQPAIIPGLDAMSVASSRIGSGMQFDPGMVAGSPTPSLSWESAAARPHPGMPPPAMRVTSLGLSEIPSTYAADAAGAGMPAPPATTWAVPLMQADPRLIATAQNAVQHVYSVKVPSAADAVSVSTTSHEVISPAGYGERASTAGASSRNDESQPMDGDVGQMSTGSAPTLGPAQQRRQAPLYFASPLVSRVNSLMDDSLLAGAPGRSASAPLEISSSQASAAMVALPAAYNLSSAAPASIALSPWPAPDDELATLVRNAYGDLTQDFERSDLVASTGAAAPGPLDVAKSTLPPAADLAAPLPSQPRATFRRNVAQVFASLFPTSQPIRAPLAAFEPDAAAGDDDDRASVTSLGLSLDQLLPI